jgi:hypothetical protein
VSILNVKSGQEAWNKLVSEHEKDNATMHIRLCQQFYSLSHNPSLTIIVFINAVLLIAQQLATIGHKLDDLEISDKLLIGLYQSWAPVCITLTLHKKSEKSEIEKITAVLKQFEANKSLLAMSSPSVKVEESELSLGDQALGTKFCGGGLISIRGEMWRIMIGKIQWSGIMYVEDVAMRSTL